MTGLAELLVESQTKEVFLPGVDTECWCESGKRHTICGNCIRNSQIAIAKGLRYDSDSGKFFKRIQ